MIEIDDKIVSADLLRECFACDIAQCKGICLSLIHILYFLSDE